MLQTCREGNSISKSSAFKPIAQAAVVDTAAVTRVLAMAALPIDSSGAPAGGLPKMHSYSYSYSYTQTLLTGFTTHVYHVPTGGMG